MWSYNHTESQEVFYCVFITLPCLKSENITGTMFACSADGLDTFRTDHDDKRTWADVGLGADLELNNNSYFFLDMERTFGNGVSRTWQVNGGFRWEWK